MIPSYTVWVPLCSDKLTSERCFSVFSFLNGHGLNVPLFPCQKMIFVAYICIVLFLFMVLFVSIGLIYVISGRGSVLFDFCFDLF